MTLTVLYTAHLHGDLDILPRLYNFLRGLRAEFNADKTLLLDLGDTCVGDVWHCEATDGRSMLIALDGMGYDVANVSGYLTDAGRSKLVELGESFRLALHNEDQPYVYEGLSIDLMAETATWLYADRLALTTVSAGEVGVAHLVQNDGKWSIETHGVYVLAADTLPDPTTAGLIDFIIAEAKHTQKRRSD